MGLKCKQKDYEGLGMRRMNDTNKALRTKLNQLMPLSQKKKKKNQLMPIPLSMLGF